MLLLAAIPKKARCQMSKEGCDTWDNIWEALVWSFTAMFEGKWPTISWDGKPLCLMDDKRLAGKPLCPKSGLKAVIWTIMAVATWSIMQTNWAFPSTTRIRLAPGVLASTETTCHSPISDLRLPGGRQWSLHPHRVRMTLANML